MFVVGWGEASSSVAETLLARRSLAQPSVRSFIVLRQSIQQIRAPPVLLARARNTAVEQLPELRRLPVSRLGKPGLFLGLVLLCKTLLCKT